MRKLGKNVQTCLSEWLARFKTCGTYLWSKKANGYVDVGATFQSYEIGGNTISSRLTVHSLVNGVATRASC